MYFRHCLLNLLLFLTFQLAYGNIVVTTNYGKVQSRILSPDESPQTCHGFIGIPFAKPPVGDLRFQKPQPPDPWADIHESKEAAPRCIQFAAIPGFPGPENVPDSEDCLHLNIILPNTEISAEHSYPVMVWVPGGGFVIGSAYEYEPAEICRNLVLKDVIVVVIQYRIGVFGFIATGDDAAPGNYGIHDQLMALRWVHENIANFGGDPDKVTIFGESAGGCSVSLLTYMPQAEPYYSGTIAQSGTAFGYYVISNKSIESFHKLSDALGCSDVETTNEKKFSCIKEKPVEDINTAIKQSFPKQLFGKPREPGKTYIGGGHGVAAMYVAWGPTVDRELVPSGGIQEMKTSKKPFITGTTEMETLMLIKPTPMMRTALGLPDETIVPSDIENDDDLVYSTMEENIQEAIFTLGSPWKGPGMTRLRNRAAEAAGEFAYVTSQGSKDNKTLLGRQIAQLSADASMNVPCILEAENKKQAGAPVWVYSFDHIRDSDPIREMDWKAAVHGMDLPMLFTWLRIPMLVPADFDEKDNKVREMMCKMWTDFAKHGRPSSDDIDWPEYESPDKPVHLKIKVDAEVSDDYHRPTVPFWTILFPEVNKKSTTDKMDQLKHEEL